MMEPYFFEIPIYRCDQKTHTKEMELLEKEWVKDEYKDYAPESYQGIYNYFHQSIWYSWRYNEIVGWISLYILGSQIRGDYIFITAKRIGKGIRKKRFRIYGKAFEHTLHRNLTSQEIFDEILSQLKKLMKSDNVLKKRYLDLSSFLALGQYVDWMDLVDKLNSYKYPRISVNE